LESNPESAAAQGDGAAGQYSSVEDTEDHATRREHSKDQDDDADDDAGSETSSISNVEPDFSEYEAKQRAKDRRTRTDEQMDAILGYAANGQPLYHQMQGQRQATSLQSSPESKAGISGLQWYSSRDVTSGTAVSVLSRSRSRNRLRLQSRESSPKSPPQRYTAMTDRPSPDSPQGIARSKSSRAILSSAKGSPHFVRSRKGTSITVGSEAAAASGKLRVPPAFRSLFKDEDTPRRRSVRFASDGNT